MLPALRSLSVLLAASAPGAATSPAPFAASSATSALPPLSAIAGPVCLIVLLGLAALFLARRRRALPRQIEILETTSLGPKRALVLARLNGELLLLGSSEAGIALLRSQPGLKEASPEPPLTERTAKAEKTASRGLVDFAARVVAARPRRSPPETSPAFEALLVESAEDQELRRKLARGQSGSIR